MWTIAQVLKSDVMLFTIIFSGTCNPVWVAKPTSRATQSYGFPLCSVGVHIFVAFFWQPFAGVKLHIFDPSVLRWGFWKVGKLRICFSLEIKIFGPLVGLLKIGRSLWELPMKANLNIYEIDPSITGFVSFIEFFFLFTWGLDWTGTGQGGRFVAGVHSGGAKLVKVGHALDTKMQQKISPWDFCLRPSLTLPPLNRISSRWVPVLLMFWRFTFLLEDCGLGSKAQLQQSLEPAKFMATVARTREADGRLMREENGSLFPWHVVFRYHVYRSIM